MAQYDFITAEEFNALKDRVNAECQRRSAEANQYNNNPTTNPNIINVTKLTDEIRTQKFNELLSVLFQFNVFPGLNLMDISYQDGQVFIGDYIFPLEGLGVIVSQLENEPRRSNDDCKTGCMGLCTNNCADICTGTCSNTCQGCTGSCEGGCFGSCSALCAGGCLDGCGSSCSGSCTGSCAGGASTYSCYLSKR